MMKNIFKLRKLRCSDLIMELKITEKKIFKFLGVVFYGKSFHTHEPWSEKNEIGNTWNRYIKLYKKYKEFLDSIRAGDEVGFEIHIEPQDYDKDRKFDIFVGLEVINFDYFPIEFYSKILPKTEYLFFNTEYKSSETEWVFREWLPESDYTQSYPYIMQTYSPKRWEENNLMDWYIPIKKKEES
jgi:AraC family transcriptional regulator